jgi:hypothetical protein
MFLFCSYIKPKLPRGIVAAGQESAEPNLGQGKK